MLPLNKFIASVEAVKNLLPDSSPARVAVLGSFNSGKSTLVNGLLGEVISPAGVLPTTGGTVIIRYGDVFNAKISVLGKTVTVFGKNNYLSSVGGTKKPFEKIQVELPAPILRNCILIDTPGIDSPEEKAAGIALDAAAGSDILVYLFHQRGMDENNKTFLYKLAAMTRGKNKKNISFWLNCNHGPCDGTSLEATRESLRQIFLSPVPLYAVNLTATGSIQALRLFLEVELTAGYVEQAGKNLKALDGSIPRRLEAAARIKDDRLFLSEFWSIQNIAGKIISASRLLSSLPPVKRELAGILPAGSGDETASLVQEPEGGDRRLRFTSPGDVKVLFYSFLERLGRDQRLKGSVDPGTLAELTGRLDRERFTILATGGFSTGKSTFFNALMAEELLPAANGPTTSAITRIEHGPARTAAVHRALQVTLPLYESEGSRAVFCRDEVLVLEKWLEHKDGEIAFIEAEVEGRFQRIGNKELTESLSRIKKIFAAGKITGATRSGSPPLLFRLLPVKVLPTAGLARKVRVTFKNDAARRLDLSAPEAYCEFCRLTGPENAFRLDAVEITSPAEYLKLATFIDAPGLDSIQKHHREKVYRLLQETDAILLFLNGRQVLTGLERKITSGRDRNLAASTPGTSAAEKTFLLVNFTDTLTAAQRETVFNYLLQNLSAAGNSFSTGPPRIHFISARDALRGSGGGLVPLLKDIEMFVMQQRRKRFYGPLTETLRTILDGSIERAGAMLNQSTSFAAKKEARETMDCLRLYRRELKNIRNTIF